MSLDLAGMWPHTKWSVKQLSLGGIVYLVGHVVGSQPNVVQPRRARTPLAFSDVRASAEREGGTREGDDSHFPRVLRIMTIRM